MQIVEQTYEEKLAMYMKCTKKELAQMLIQCNEIIHKNLPQTVVQPTTTVSFCRHEMEWVSGTGGNYFFCKKCGYRTGGTQFTYSATQL